MKIRAIITGATGMVGEGVLHECLNHPEVESVLVINRHTCRVTHPKLKEIIHQNFFDLTAFESQMQGYNACFFCLGVSSVGMKKDLYYKLTYTLTMNFANAVCKQNPNMVFCYISGAGTDSTEKGLLAWARVKGKTENDLSKLPFKQAYAFRPSYIQPTEGLKNTLKPYKYIGWMYPFLRAIIPNHVSTLQEVGLAMINAVLFDCKKRILEVQDIIELAKMK